MSINMPVRHRNLNALELSALLWDGIELEATTQCNAWADAMYDRISQGRPDMISQVPQNEIRFYIRKALALNGRRSVECGSSSEEWNDHVQEWCREQVKRTFKV